MRTLHVSMCYRGGVGDMIAHACMHVRVQEEFSLMTGTAPSLTSAPQIVEPGLSREIMRTNNQHHTHTSPPPASHPPHPAHDCGRLHLSRLWRVPCERTQVLNRHVRLKPASYPFVRVYTSCRSQVTEHPARELQVT